MPAQDVSAVVVTVFPYTHVSLDMILHVLAGVEICVIHDTAVGKMVERSLSEIIAMVKVLHRTNDIMFISIPLLHNICIGSSS